MSPEDYLEKFRMLANQKAFICPSTDPLLAESLCEEWNETVMQATKAGLAHSEIRKIWEETSFIKGSLLGIDRKSM